MRRFILKNPLEIYRAKLAEPQGEIYKCSIPLGDFNTSFLIILRSSIKNNNKDVDHLNNIMNMHDLIGMYTDHPSNN